MQLAMELIAFIDAFEVAGARDPCLAAKIAHGSFTWRVSDYVEGCVDEPDGPLDLAARAFSELRRA